MRLARPILLESRLARLAKRNSGRIALGKRKTSRFSLAKRNSEYTALAKRKTGRTSLGKRNTRTMQPTAPAEPVKSVRVTFGQRKP